MTHREFLARSGLSELNLNPHFLEAEFSPGAPDRTAAWELYVELLTRITTQRLAPDEGDEKAALDSVYSLFPLTRELLRKHGAGAAEFAKLAIPVLNQIIRPFTAKWHRVALSGGLGEPVRCAEFRAELSRLQKILRGYTQALAAMASVDDLTTLESP